MLVIPKIMSARQVLPRFSLLAQHPTKRPLRWRLLVCWLQRRNSTG